MFYDRWLVGDAMVINSSFFILSRANQVRHRFVSAIPHHVRLILAPTMCNIGHCQHLEVRMCLPDPFAGQSDVRAVQA